MKFIAVLALVAVTGCGMGRSSFTSSRAEWYRMDNSTADRTADLDACASEVAAANAPLVTGAPPSGGYLLTNDMRRSSHLDVCMRDKGWSR